MSIDCPLLFCKYYLNFFPLFGCTEGIYEFAEVGLRPGNGGGVEGITLLHRPFYHLRNVLLLYHIETGRQPHLPVHIFYP